MDYVLFGMGYGATLMLLGWALRAFGPERKYKNIDSDDIDQSILQRRWIRFIQGLGGVISIAGTSMVVFTFVIMLVNPTDETGSFIALVIWAFIAIAVLIWCWFYVASFGVVGIWSREAGYRTATKASSRTRGSRSSSKSSSKVVQRSSLQNQPDDTAIGPVIADSHEQSSGDDQDQLFATEPHDIVASEDLAVDLASDPTAVEPPPAVADENDPEYDFGDSTETTVPSEIGGRTEALRRLRERQARSDNSSR